MDAFLADGPDANYEMVVNRLLDSPRYGEHMARFWLDAARYGDTHGLHLDNYREIWPYRDWVIKAFNANKPFDQFVVEQLAGDLLPNPTLDQLVATGYNRCHVSTSEGGSIEEEVYVRNIVDQVDTNGTVFLGMTIGCAALPRPQVRPGPDEGLLPALCVLQQYRRPGDGWQLGAVGPDHQGALGRQKAALVAADRKIAAIRQDDRRRGGQGDCGLRRTADASQGECPSAE